MLKSAPFESQQAAGTVVGVNVSLTGTLKDQNDIVVHGMVEGEIHSERSVSVGESAQVKGPIRGQNITVAGVVRGSIDAIEQLEIAATGKIFGGITTKNLVVHSGATIMGKVAMAGKEDVDKDEEMTAQNEPDKPQEPSKDLEPDEE